MMNLSETIRKLETVTIELQSSRNQLALLGVERDVLDRLDKIISDARAYVRLDTLITDSVN